MPFDVAGAIKAGATPDQIASFLAEKQGFDLEGALGSGASVDQVIGFLSKSGGKPERSWGQAAKDTAVQLAEGVNTVAGSVPNLVAPDSRAAEFFNRNAEYWREAQSEPLKQRIAAADREISRAGENGILSQAGEAIRQYADDPALAARFITTNAASMIPGLGAAKLGQAAAIARGASAARAAQVGTTAAGGANALLNAGGARGEAFEDIKKTLIAQGLKDEQATEQALKDSRIAAAVGGVAGFVSGKTGLEGSIVGRSGAGGLIRSAASGLGKELAGEQLEEVTPKLTTNYLAGQYDGRYIGQDIGRTMVETAIGSGPGAVVSGGMDAVNSRRRAVAEQSLQQATDAAGAAAAANEMATVDLDTAVNEVEQSVSAYLQPNGAIPTPEQAVAEPEIQPLTPQEKQELARQQLQATPIEDPLAELRLQAGPTTTMADIAQRRDEVETAAIERMMAEEKAAPQVPTAQPVPDLAQASEQETSSNRLAGLEQQSRQRMVDTLVQSAAEPSGYFASRMIPAIDQQLSVLNQTPLTQEERARVVSLSGAAQAFSQPTMPEAPAPVIKDTGADNSSMEARIPEKIPRPSRILGQPTASYSDEQLTAMASKPDIPAVSRRSASIELTARQAEQPSATQDQPATAPVPVAAPPVAAGREGYDTPVRLGQPKNVTLINEGDMPNQPEAQQAPAQPATENVADVIKIGRNQAPLNEGGRPFRTRNEAAQAKKLQPMMRVVSVPGGYALTEKTPAQVAAQERAAQRLAQARTSPKGEPIPAHALIAANGGMQYTTKSDMGVDGNPMIGNRRLFAAAGRGMSIERATEMLVADGYLSQGASHNDAYALIKKSLTQPQYNADGIERVAEMEAAAQFEDYLAAQEEVERDPWEDVPAILDEYTDDELIASGYDAASDAIKAEVQALLEMADARGIDGESILLQAHEQTRNATERDYYESAKSALQAAIQGSNGNSSAPVGSQGEEGQESWLTAPTRGDILASQERASTERTTQEREQVRRESEAGAGLFELTSEDGRQDTTGSLFSRERESKLSTPSDGRIVNVDAEITGGAPVPGSKQTIQDGDTSHTFTVVDASRLGSQGRLIQQIARTFGKRLVAFESETLQADGFVRDGDQSSIYLNVESQVSPMAVFGHELTHQMKRDNPKAYAALEAVVRRNIAEGGMERFSAEYGEGADLEELSSDLVGNRFREPDFWEDVFNEVAAQNDTGAAAIVQRVGQSIRRAVDALLQTIQQYGFNADAYVTNLEEIRDAVRVAMVDYAKQQRTPAMAGVNDAAAVGGVAKFSFAGRESKTADKHRLDDAQAMISKGADAETVRQDTGWFKGADGKWRYEINDADAKLRPALKSLDGGGYDAKQIASVTYRKREDGTYDVTLNPPSPKRTSDFVTLTGISRGAMRAVLPDSAVAAVDRNEGDEDLIGDFEEAKRINVSFEFGGFNALPLDDVIDHPALFAAYPALRNVMVQVDPKLGIGGSFSYVDHNDGTTSKVVRLGSARQLSTLLHEIQHGIQGIEGFASGGSPNEFRDESADAEMLRDGAILAVMMRSQGTIEKAKALFVQRFKREPAFGAESAALSGESPESMRARADNALAPHERYRRLAGEVEARNTQARQAMTDAQRRATPPSQTADVADSDVIVMFNGKVARNAPPPANATTGLLFSRSRNPQTETPQFKRWFGDSKVVDADGNPLVVYHGTRNDFSVFDYGKIGAQGRAEGAGFYFTTNKDVASGYGSPMEVFLSIKKPLPYSAKPFGKPVLQKIVKRVAEIESSKEGHGIGDGYLSNYGDVGYEGLNNVVRSAADSLSGDESAIDQISGIVGSGVSPEYVNLAVYEVTGFDGVFSKGFSDSGDSDNSIYVAFFREQIKSATSNSGEFDPSNPDIRKSRRRNYGTLTPAQEQALRNVGGITVDQTLKERFDQLRSKLSGSAAGIADQFAELETLDKDAYMEARLSKGTDDTVEALMLYGKPFINKDGVLDVSIRDEGFGKVLGRLEGEQDRFLWWVAAQRAERLKSQGLERLFTDQDIGALKELNKGNLPSGLPRGQAYARALQEMNDFNDAVMEVAQASGLIDQATRKLFKDMPYVPFYRVMEEEGGVSGPSFSGGLTNQSAWKKLKGGKQKLHEDLLSNVLQNWSHLYAASAKNRAANAALKAGVRAGIAARVPAGTKGSVRVRENGIEVHYLVHDEGVMAAISAIEYRTPRLFRILGTFKRMLSLGVTASPTYKVKNLIRDSVSAVAISDLSYNAAGNVYGGFKATSKDSQTFASMLAGGGLIRFGTMLDGNNADRTRKMVAKEGGILLNRKGWQKLSGMAADTWEAYNEIGDRFENANRAALYEQLMKKGYSQKEANFMARDLMDFTMQGRWPLIRFLTETVPFMNARIQGLYKLGKAAKADPQKFGYVVGAVAMASIALMLAYEDDEEWKERPDWDRDTNWWFKIGDMSFRIPKPFEVGAIGTLAERGWELAFNKEMDVRRFGKSLSNMIFDTFAMDPTPQLVKPLIDIYANRAGFTNRAIENMAMQRLRPEDRYTDRTSYAARFLGNVGLPSPMSLSRGQYESMSPMQIDYLIRGYFGWLGTAVTTTVDVAMRPMMGGGERPDMRLKDMFFVGNFAETLPAGSSRYLDQVYEQSKEIEQAYNSHRAALKRGDKEEAKKIYAEEMDKIKAHKKMSRYNERISEISGKIKRVESSQSLSGETKRKMIDELTRKRNEVAKRASLSVKLD